MRRSIIAFVLGLASPVFAQSLTPAEIAAMVEETVTAVNPYAELLNNPDPARSLAAMKIMLESGDDQLIDMALEFGLLSTSPSVKRVAFEGYLRSKPVLSFRFDGSVTENSNFKRNMTWENATMTPESIGYWRMAVGEYDDKNKCFKHFERSECFITINADGVLWRTASGNSTGRFDIGEAGMLVGSSNLANVSETIPTTAQLID